MVLKDMLCVLRIKHVMMSKYIVYVLIRTKYVMMSKDMLCVLIC